MKWLKGTWIPGIEGLDTVLNAALDGRITVEDLEIMTASDGAVPAQAGTGDEPDGKDGHMEFSVTAALPNVDGEGTEYIPICEGLICTILAEAYASEYDLGLTPGETYWFDLSGEGIPGTVNLGNGNGTAPVPDPSLHWAPFTYVGRIKAYKLSERMATTEEYAAENAEDRYLFISDYNLTHTVRWDKLDEEDLIFGRDYSSGGIDYFLRAPSVGREGLQDGVFWGVPENNEWDVILDKDMSYIKNWEYIFPGGRMPAQMTKRNLLMMIG